MHIPHCNAIRSGCANASPPDDFASEPPITARAMFPNSVGRGVYRQSLELHPSQLRSTSRRYPGRGCLHIPSIGTPMGEVLPDLQNQKQEFAAFRSRFHGCGCRCF